MQNRKPHWMVKVSESGLSLEESTELASIILFSGLSVEKVEFAKADGETELPSWKTDTRIIIK